MPVAAATVAVAAVLALAVRMLVQVGGPTRPRVADNDQHTPTKAAPGSPVGTFERAKGDLNLAIADHSQAIKTIPTEAAADNNRGLFKQANGSLGAAIADYNRALELDPKDAAIYRNRGLAEQARGDQKVAVQDYADFGAIQSTLATTINGRTNVVVFLDSCRTQSTNSLGLINAPDIAAGEYHTLALNADGTVVGWGSNRFGETLNSEGTVVSWGDNSFGETSIPFGSNNVVASTAGSSFSLALLSDGTVVGWGSDISGETAVPPGLNAVLQKGGGGGKIEVTQPPSPKTIEEGAASVGHPSPVTPSPASPDPKLVGLWSTKIAAPAGFVACRWDQLSDGRYILTVAGAPADTGTVLAENGKIHRVSDAPDIGAEDLTYKFEGSSLVTFNPETDSTPHTWKRLRSGTATATSHFRRSGGSPDDHSGRGWQHYFPRSVTHLPF
jgi:hypothetical protein